MEKSWGIVDFPPLFGRIFHIFAGIKFFAMDNDQKLLYTKYIGLLKFIIDKGGCDWQTIQNSNEIGKLYNGTITERTFFRHRKQIEDSFQIQVHCRNKRYFVKEDDINKIESNYFHNWLKQSFSLSELITQNISMNNRIILDTPPAGQNLLPQFVEAMRDNLQMKIVYQPFEKEAYSILINPLLLKVFKQRWYVIAQVGDTTRVYSLGRITLCEVTTDRFKLKNNFDPEKFFDFTYGVTIGDEKQKPSTIKIKAGYQSHYLRELPLHESQVENEMGNESIFTYFLKPSNEFIMELLSYGDGVEVLQPDSLRNEIKSRIERMNKKYN